MTVTAGSKDARCCWSQTTWSPLLPLASVGQPGSGGGAGHRLQRLGEHAPLGLAGRLPGPPRQPGAAVGRPQRAEAREVLGRRVVVGLAERRDRRAVDAVVARACAPRPRRRSRRCPSSRPAAGSPGQRRGRGRPSTAAAGGSRRTGTTSGRSGTPGPTAARSAATYCCAAAYLPSYWDSASITRQSAPDGDGVDAHGGLARRVVAVDELPGAHLQPVGLQRLHERRG